MRIGVVVLVLAATSVSQLADELATARRSWDPDAVVAVQSRIRLELVDAADDDAAMLRAQAGLAVAEVLRVEFEGTPERQRETRRLLGDRIDAVAEEALATVDNLPESSERERMRADLIATLIRSDYRAKRYEPELHAAVARALDLDPDNPLAHVAAAKPLMFAPADRGRDVGAALAHLDRALALDPGSESARLLRATAREQAGDVGGARDDARTVLAANPRCTPARRLLDRIGDS